MNRLAFPCLIAAAATVGCQQDTKNIERKLDQIIQKLDHMPSGGGAGAANQRPQRPEPDRSKTYAVPIAGDPFEGPADAKITLVEAYDYG